MSPLEIALLSTMIEFVVQFYTSGEIFLLWSLPIIKIWTVIKARVVEEEEAFSTSDAPAEFVTRGVESVWHHELWGHMKVLWDAVTQSRVLLQAAAIGQTMTGCADIETAIGSISGRRRRRKRTRLKTRMGKPWTFFAVLPCLMWIMERVVHFCASTFQFTEREVQKLPCLTVHFSVVLPEMGSRKKEGMEVWQRESW